jgi:hypothetical protein
MQKSSSGIEKHLDGDEKIYWQGFPQARILFTSLDMAYVPLSIICLWPLMRELWVGAIDIGGIIFLIPLLYFAVGRFYIKYQNKKRTIYLVTNKRIIIFNKSRERIDQEQDIKTVINISKKISFNGIGSIRFGKLPYIQATGGNSGMDFMINTKLFHIFGRGLFFDEPPQWIPVFYDIEDAQYVFDLVNGIKTGASVDGFDS